MSFARMLGRAVGRALAKVGIASARKWVDEKVSDPTEPNEYQREHARRAAEIVAKRAGITKAGIVLVAVFLSIGATCVRDFGIGVGEGVVIGVKEEFGPRPTPTRTPVVSEPTPNAETTPTPTPSPASSPSPSTPTPTAAAEPTMTPAPPPTPGNCAPKPGPTPVTLIYRGGCPRHMEPLDFEGEGAVNVPGDKKLCAVKSGTGNGRTAWRLGYGLGRQGMRLERFGEVWLQFDAGRGCTDAYGRHFPDCETLYRHPEADAEYTWGGYSKPAFCEDLPTPTPAPTAGPTPTPGGAPRGDRCTCQVACSMRLLGWNDNAGLPPNVVVGGQFSGDVTCRQAQFQGDQRGQPVDRSNGPEWCEPSEDPVLFDVSAPVPFRIGNDGYRIDFNDLAPGGYRISVTPRPGATYRNGEPVTVCPWGHNDSVKTVLEFEVR